MGKKNPNYKFRKVAAGAAMTGAGAGTLAAGYGAYHLLSGQFGKGKK